MEDPDSEVRHIRTPSTGSPLDDPDHAITAMTIGGSGLKPRARCAVRR